MATRLVYTAYANHPRVWMRDTEKAALDSRRNTASGLHDWETWWDGPQKTYLEKSYDQTTFWTSDFYLKMIGYATRGWILGHTFPAFDFINEAIGHARYVAQNAVTTSKETQRSILLGLTAVYDILHAYTTASDKAVIGQGMLDSADQLDIPDGVNNKSKEMMDGHTRIDQALTAMAMIALLGESGSGYDYTTSSVTRLDRALDFWYGGNAGVSFNGYAAMDTDRHYAANGGAGKGLWYQFYSNFGLYQMLHAMDRGLATMTLQGDTYNPWVNETWFNDSGLWFLHLLRGDGEYFTLGDTYRSNGPIFKNEQRVTAAMLAAHGNYRKPMHWYWDQWQSQGVAQNQGNDYKKSLCFILLDKADAASTATAPINVTPAIPKLKIFDPPGSVVYQSTWDKPNSCIIHMNFPKWYYRGHIELDCGMIQITVNDDVVLCNTGYYHTNDVNANFGGSHNRNWKNQSISKSGVPLCDDDSDLPHSSYAADGSYGPYPSGEGGQYWKTMSGGAVRDPDNVINMLADGGGLGWRRVMGRTASTGVELVGQDSSQYFFYADTRHAYLKEYTDLDGSAERTRICEHKIMLIVDQGPWPIIFRVVRMKSRLTSMKKQDHWHFYGNPTLAQFDVNGQLDALGYRATELAGVGGKIAIGYYNFAALNETQIGDGTKTAYGPNQFKYDPHIGGSLQSYPPTSFINTNRNILDLGRFRVKITPKVQALEDYFVCLLMPLGVNDPTPSYTWVESADYFGVRFADGRVYQIHKTQVGYVSPGSAVDTQPPVMVTGFQIANPSSQVAQLTWTALSGDPSMDAGGRYRAYRRVKV